ncbi:MAG: type II secretion system secretin GspD [Inhella sp.]|jgi:general secretion pathway protein D|uniref:type II secretion system secretin GspD n=1 Tax=Inhella sp. TaxID=1921806 RepID=UPI0022BB8047|nr:type II secretion system secretin GspD [Inhella sp.]MCZ8234188.1 type II secretion system secretin GspD [Inhella sp.]
MTTAAPFPLRTLAMAALTAALATPALVWSQANRAPAVRADTQVTLNFVNADVEAVTRAMGSMLGKTLVVDPRVKGQMTLYSDQPLRPAEAYAQYLTALRGLGFAVVDAAGLLKVVPEAEAKLLATGVLLDDQRGKGDLIVTQVFSLKHENANNLVAILRPLVNINNTINANPGNNSLVITDYADNLARLAKIIAALDTPAASDVEIVPLQHAVAADLASLVQKLGDGAAAAPGAPGGTGGSTVLPDPRANALILRAANPVRLAALKALVLKLDQPSPDASSPIRVVHLKNADATKLAQVLRAAFSQGGGGGGSNAGPANSPTPAVSAVPTVGSGAGNAGAGGGLGLGSTPGVATSASPSTGGFVQADPATNSLIITAPEPLYRQMRVVIDQLDGRRAQVFVEAMIVKLDTSKSAQFGVQWQNVFGNKGDSTITGAGTNFGAGSSNIITATGAIANGLSGVTTALANSPAPAGLNLGVLKKFGQYYTLGALANFLEQEGGGNILSMPTLVALDNEEAQILVGQNVPFLTGSYAQGTGNSTVNPFQTVERRDVGLILKVKSQIGEGGAIRMVVTQELSSIGSQSAQGPITNKTSVQTTVSVDNNDLLVLGGLMQDEYSDGNSGVPGLSKIPLIGNLFKGENRRRTKSNLMIFLRPIVMRSAEDATTLTLDRYQQIRAVQGDLKPERSLVLPDTGAPLMPAQPAPRGQ